MPKDAVCQWHTFSILGETDVAVPKKDKFYRTDFESRGYIYKEGYPLRLRFLEQLFVAALKIASYFRHNQLSFFGISVFNILDEICGFTAAYRGYVFTFVRDKHLTVLRDPI